MSNNNVNQRSQNRVAENYYFVIFLVYFASMISSSIRVGVIATALILLVVICDFIYGSIIRIKVDHSVIPVMAYMFWCAISIVWFGFSGVGYGAYLQSISNALLPMMFAFIHLSDYDKFWKKVMYAYIVAGFIGTFLQVTQPSWYTSYCLSRGFDYRRLSFAYGSIIMGTMGAVAVITAFRMIIRSSGKRGKTQYLFTCLFSFLSMQRSAWIVVLVTLMVAHYYIIFKYKVVRIRFLFFELLGLIVILAVFGNQIMNTINSWIAVHQFQYGGKITVGETISERSYQWIRGIESSNLFIGSGFGSRGHKAAANGFINYVADGNWVLILCESGIIGLLLFSYICITALRKGFHSFRALFLPVGVILAFMFQSIGSNVLEQQLIAPLFWLSTGQLLTYDTSQGMEYE